MADDHEPGETQHDTAKPVHVQDSQGVQVGDNTTQVNFYLFGDRTRLARPPQPPLDEEGSPYRGLPAFEEHDEPFFFGL